MTSPHREVDGQPGVGVGVVGPMLDRLLQIQRLSLQSTLHLRQECEPLQAWPAVGAIGERRTELDFRRWKLLLVEEGGAAVVVDAAQVGHPWLEASHSENVYQWRQIREPQAQKQERGRDQPGTPIR